jgi:hypothetical protein
MICTIDRVLISIFKYVYIMNGSLHLLTQSEMPLSMLQKERDVFRKVPESPREIVPARLAELTSNRSLGIVVKAILELIVSRVAFTWYSGCSIHSSSSAFRRREWRGTIFAF